MNQESQKAYLDLINALLNCPSGQEVEILKTYPDLIDDNLIRTMKQVAVNLLSSGDRDSADYLNYVAGQLTEVVNEVDFLAETTAIEGISEEAFDFLEEVLDAVCGHDENSQVLYSLLSKNQDKLNDRFAKVLQVWASEVLPAVEPKLAQSIAGDIFRFSNLMLDFPNGNRTNNLEIAIAGYEIAATIYTRAFSPEDWAGIHYNLAFAYSQRSRSDQNENHQQMAEKQEKAIAEYKTSLEFYTKETFPEKWATIQHNLGFIYFHRIKNDSVENIEEAIRYYKASLQVFNQKQFPNEWATSQNSLGTAYSGRLKGDRLENLELAISFYNKTLQVYTQNKYPDKWAMIQTNLGSAYQDRIKGDKENNLEIAISCYKRALQVYTQDKYLDEWATIQNNLAATYWNRIYGDERENREKAIAAYQAALQVRTREAFPQDWATIQNNLGAAYFDRTYGDERENLEKAIAACQAALQVRTREDFPLDWAVTQLVLGHVYRKLGKTSQAIECFELSLEIRQITGSAEERLNAGRSLGYTAFMAGLWTKAIKGYEVAIEGVEQSREWANRDSRKAEILSAAIDVYARIVQAYINIDRPDRAIEYVERSKARNLVELLANKDIYPKREVYPNSEIYQSHCQQLEQLRREIPGKQRELEILGSSREREEENRDRIKDVRSQINQLQEKLNELIAEINQIDPTFSITQKVQPIPFSDIQSLTDENTAIVEWYITGSQIFTFIITRHYPHPIVVASEEITALANWDEDYRDSYQNQKTQWINNLASRLQTLAEILHIDEILSRIDESFAQSDAQCNRLILIPHRYLHLFPLHALPLADGKLLFERFSQGVGYAPSCQLLKQAKDQEQHRPDFTRLFAIQNPTRKPPRPLLGSQLEIDKIRRHFAPESSIILKEAEATEANLYQRMEQMRSSHCIHFSCHGKFDPESPLKSALLLADPEGTLGEEANLTLGEVFEKLYLNQCRIVTFSACESGMTDPNSISDEYIGLPSGFLYAGSLSVVSTLWSVDPIATTLLMVKFYQNLNRLPEIKTGDVAIALNKAQNWLRRLTYKKWARIQNHPQFKKLVEEAFANSPKGDRNKFKDSLFESLLTDRQPLPFLNPYYWSAFVAIGI